VSSIYAEVPPERLLEGHTQTLLGDLLDALGELAPASPRREYVRGSVQADGAGVAELRFTPPPGIAWSVERIAVVGAGEVTVYVQEVDPRYVVDYTPDGTIAVADETHPIYVPANTDLIVRFEGATPGDQCSANAQVTLA